MAVYRFSLIKQGWHVPLVFESELRDDLAVSREVSALQSVYTLGGEPPARSSSSCAGRPPPRSRRVAG